ncbi:MAG: N-6 DNA methylase [Fibrobacteraceae bacterium]|nr:N-6 DNA methylase [Fibrobacteraceae bacterium]
MSKSKTTIKKVKQNSAVKKFVEYWKGKGDEKQETARFWLELLSDVLGIKDATKFIEFEKPVFIDKTQKYIDAYIPSTKVLIEQKSAHIKLNSNAVQSDGELLTPFGQAFRYNTYLPYNEKVRWIIVSNFKEILIYDMNKPNKEPEQILLRNLAKEYYRLQFLADEGNEHIQKEMEVSLKAGDLVGKLYDALIKQYKNSNSKESLHSLNVLCVRLVFCLYAEDAGIFGKHGLFHDYLKQFKPNDVRKALIELFEILDTKEKDRDPYDETMLSEFPYVNGGLFKHENIEIPNFNEETLDILLNKASAGFDWSQISPTIFGALFESTLNPETRRSGGMHFTSIENIHKVIDPLFLDELREEYSEIKQTKSIKTRNQKFDAFQDKLKDITFFDPACGSGNFLTETYLSLRRLENELLAEKQQNGQISFDTEIIKVSIGQFYGIEINDFAVTVAKTSLWIAESQMMKETEEIVNANLDFLPLKSYANIVEGNALRMDWESVVPKEKLDYIMGNPPFVGYSLQSKEQKADILSVYVDEKGKPYKTAGKIDYVAGWYFKAAELISNQKIKCAFVATNSITQGEQVAGIWKPLMDRFRIHIDFAHRTFRWDSESTQKAHVHCVIIGFSVAENTADKRLYDNGIEKIVKNINAYLVEAPNVFIESRSTPICDVPKMTTGNRPADGGHLIIEADDYDDFVKREPNAVKYIKKLTGAAEYINNKDRYCLWLVGVSPAELRKMPEVMKRVDACRQDRLNGAPDRQKLADTPTIFRETFNPDSYIIVPRVSSENRRYIPLGFLNDTVVPTDSAVIIPEATLYHFGILTSNVHMAWMRAVAGRLKSDYRYSKDIVYNNFPWCNPTDAQKAKIEQTAQSILDARAKYPECSLADLYDETFMPIELRKAHQENDRAVMETYGFSKDITESEIVAALFKMYEGLVKLLKA